MFLILHRIFTVGEAQTFPKHFPTNSQVTKLNGVNTYNAFKGSLTLYDLFKIGYKLRLPFDRFYNLRCKIFVVRNTYKATN